LNFLFSCSHCFCPAIHPASVAVQSSIPTIPCITFNQLILPCYLFPMFACTEPRSACTVYPELQREPRSTNQNLRLEFACFPMPLTPLFATHMSRPQITENPTALSPFLATHTKTTGVYTNNSHFGSPRVSSRGTFSSSYAKSVRRSAHPLLSPPVTSHESSATCLPDRLPVPRTCILRTIGAILSLQQTFYGSPFLLFFCVGGCDG
jgi:hypothetical protein